MKKIWRVENNDGIGCYTYGHIPFIKRMIKRHDKNSATPIPAYDIGIKRDIDIENEICGFIDKKQALNWFSKYELNLLMGFGFFLKEIEVTKITAIGQRQVLAVRECNG